MSAPRRRSPLSYERSTECPATTTVPQFSMAYARLSLPTGYRAATVPHSGGTGTADPFCIIQYSGSGSGR